MKKVCVIGHFGFGENLLNGQTVKTKVITNELVCRFGTNNVMEIDTRGGVKILLSLFFKTLCCMRTCKNIVIFPAHNGLRIITPILSFEKKLFKRKLHYVVIGGWLPEFLKNKKMLVRQLKKFDGIYVETSTMKFTLEEMGFQNIIVMPNCKKLHILDESELVYSTVEPYKLCTFSRVMKEKGIEDAINAVKEVNEHNKRTVYTLDIFGQVDTEQTEWFEELQKRFPSYVKYGGFVPFDKSTEVLKNYSALLFPTFYEGEGFAGTLIDAFAAGIPVVASDWKYNSELISEGVTGTLYHTNNKEELIEKLLWIQDNIDVWNVMKNQCLQKATQYNPSVVIETLIKDLS